jgi:hypothetical protein
VSHPASVSVSYSRRFVSVFSCELLSHARQNAGVTVCAPHIPQPCSLDGLRGKGKNSLRTAVPLALFGRLHQGGRDLQTKYWLENRAVGEQEGTNLDDPK